MSTIKTNNLQIGQSTTATNNFTWYQPASPDGTVRLGNGNAGSVTDRITITSAGSVGIGTTAPQWSLDVSGSGITSESNSGFGSNLYYADGAWKYRGNGYGGVLKLAGTDGATTISNAANNTAGAGAAATTFERVRILNTGEVIINASAIASFFDGMLNVAGRIHIKDSAGPLYVWNPATTGDNTFAAFGTEGTFTSRGSIYYNRSTGQVVYATTSDYRAKDILGPVENPGATLDALKVYTGKMHGAEMPYPMLVAHEAQEVVPFAVSGEKDAVNEDGSPKYQQMDYSILIPLLIAEIQDLRARLAALEGKQL